MLQAGQLHYWAGEVLPDHGLCDLHLPRLVHGLPRLPSHRQATWSITDNPAVARFFICFNLNNLTLLQQIIVVLCFDIFRNC